ncbi:MAG TPA: acetyl-CoA carboxylase carboxyltransferase subunit alpha [Candidatus Limiplasma sp.]|nr:acetyl-CoA carboxylase carboxyltransferase subunit alpha [Candidatus Limiplasma sp.]HRX08067.1 acetyl-CoA carboxylase carboxyltransferase subunit alpha [Candidatus Limiplasma sp.]
MSGAYQRVKAARQQNRATSMYYINQIFDGFMEMHGDRRFSDDNAIVAGIAKLGGQPVTVIGIEKGVETEEKIRRNFGSAHPEGYRKALRQMKLAEKFRRPVVCLIDTSGAYPGIGAEERGQGQAIAENLMTMMGLKVPIISVLIGEGGSGGALALAVADRVWMLENAVYSVISPEGAASIVWKDAGKANEASDALKLTADDLYGFGIVERVFSEENGDFEKVSMALRAALTEEFHLLSQKTITELTRERYQRFRRMGGADQ